MMMMTSLNDVQTKLSATLGTYKNLKIMDAVLVSDRNNQEYKDPNTATAEQGYSYTSTKLAEITKQKQAQFDALASVLEEIKKDGTVKATTLQESAGLTDRSVSSASFGGLNDDGAEAVNKNKAEVVSDFGLKELVDAKDKDITKEQKKKLASAYLTQIETLNKTILNDKAKPVFEGATDTATGNNPNEALKQYASLKKDYIEAVKKGLKDNVIESTDGDIDKATFGNEKPNQKFDPAYKTYTGGVKNGTPSAENTAKAQRLVKVKDQLDSIRKQFKNAGIENLDELLAEDNFEPSEAGKTKVGSLNDEQKKKGFSAGGATPDNAWKPIATKVKTILEEQTKANNGIKKAGITLENFTDKLLEDSQVAETLNKAYTNSSAKPLSSIETIFKTEAGVGPTSEKGQAPADISKETEGAADANRETALKDITPITINTNRDLGGKSIAEVKLADGKPFDIKIDGNDTVVENTKGKTAIINFRGQPGVLLKRDGNYFVRFYDRQKAGTGSVITTGIAQVDPKLVFFDKDFKKPKTNIDTNMVKVETTSTGEKRTVIDYYVRSYNKEKATDNSKVLYVARNFSDTIDRLKAIRAAQYFAAMDADPINFKTKEQKQEAKTDKQTTATPVLTVGVGNETTPKLENTPVVVTRS